MKIFAETDRLILRKLLPTDIEGMYALDAAPEVHSYFGNRPILDRAQAMGLRTICAAAHRANLGSNRVLQKLGFQWKNTFTYQDLPCY